MSSSLPHLLSRLFQKFSIQIQSAPDKWGFVQNNLLVFDAYEVFEMSFIQEKNMVADVWRNAITAWFTDLVEVLKQNLYTWNAHCAKQKHYTHEV